MSKFNFLLLFWIVIALVLVPVQLKVTAPYGRHMRKGWGKTMPYRWGWMLMELVSPMTFSIFFITGDNPVNTVTIFIFFLWISHYFNRAVIYPMKAKMEKEAIPIAIVLFAAGFNLMNGFFNGYYLSNFSSYTTDWFYTPPFLIGTGLFIAGAGINIWSDKRLVSLRKPGETDYKIPQDGLFRWVSCPNHFGEIIEWTGFAMLCWNLPALSFAIWTAANLIPRALSHHRWYKSNFEDYPSNRKAVIPWLL
jgi:protein-S-isoprenylcysteine O-methyltransferase Ste14